MSKLLSLLCLFISIVSYAQDGFVKAYDFDRPHAFFSSMVLDNDTLILSGIAFSEEEPYQQGFLFAKVDTNGILLDYQIHFDSLGDDFARQQIWPTGLIKVSDNSGYLATGSIFFRDTDYLMKLDNDGNIEFLKEFSDSLTIIDSFQRIMETEDGFLIFGSSSFPNFNPDASVMKTDKNGNKIWKKFYGTPDWREFLGSVIKVNDNEYILGMPTSTNISIIPELNKFYNTIISIDSLGNERWRWQGEPDTWETAGLPSIHLTEEGNLAYLAWRLDWNDTYNHYIRKMKFIKRDTVNFDKLFEKEVGVFSSDNGFYNSILTSDEGWLAMGNYYAEIENTSKIDGTAWTYKLNMEGDSLWSRHDTVFASVLGFGSPGHRLFSAVELPSGSIIAVGDIKTSFNGPKWYGLLLKMDKHGCIDGTNCNPVNVLDILEFESGIQVFPNPTQDEVNVRFLEPLSKEGKLILYDQIGQTIQEFILKKGQLDYHFDLEKWGSGIYYYQVLQKGKLRKSGKLIIQN